MNDRIFIPQKSLFSHPNSKISTWKETKARLIPEVWPEFIPSFKIARNDQIFTIGSCFARNIEEHLDKLGYSIPMLRFIVPQDEWPNRPNGILNKYSPVDIYQELKWCEQIYEKGGKVTFSDIEPLLFQCNHEHFIDLHIGGYVPVLKERALARRQEIYNVFSQVFTSQVVIMTLGLIEVWYDSYTDLFIQRVPSENMKKEVGRFKFMRLSYPECYDYIQKAISLIRKHCPDCKFLLTTSPVPLKETFTDEDVITANSFSKSVLRAVCGAIVEKNSLVDYFPSYESVIYTKDWGVYELDFRHVTDDFVGKIAARLIQYYC